MTKIIILLNSKLNKRDYHRFGIEIFQKRGFDVETWDCMTYLYPEYAKIFTPKNPILFSNNKLFSNKIDIQSAFNKLKRNDIIIDMIGIFDYKGYWGIKSKICVCFLGSMPKPNFEYKLIIRKLVKSFIANPIYLFTKIKYKIINYFRNQSIVDFIIIDGEETNHINKFKTNENSEIIKAHSFDFDSFLKEETSNKKLDNSFSSRYAVFLDEDVPNHPDYLLYNVAPDCPANKYYSEINSFFNKFEEYTGYEVIIAAHPKSYHNYNNNLFGGRKYFANVSIQLVKHSECVLLHNSSAMNFGILYYKPIILLDSDNYDFSLRAYIKERGNSLNIKPINISTNVNMKNISLGYDKEQYNHYKKKYIKQENTPNKYIWEIFCDNLEKV